jgi:succinate-semialdehyde dehydrogenase/glutarate-semialdehyde dehydrogenase
MGLRAIDPFTGRLLREVPETPPAACDAALHAAARAQAEWSRVPVSDRARALGRIAAVLRRERDALAALAVAEMGKPVTAARAEVEKCAWVCEHYAAAAPALLAPREVASSAARSLVRAEPMGVVLAVMPWNFPFWQVLRALAPALVAGNGVALKHAASVPGCAEAVAGVLRDAGLPPALTPVLQVGAERVAALVEHPAVAAVTVTGGEAAGAAVGAVAGRALKKVVLELGGSDAFVVLDDAPMPATARQAALARTQNNGQSCIAAKRFVVVEPVAEAFEAALVEAMRALRVGDPADPATEVGPLARPDLVTTLEHQVARSVAAGARLALPGGRRDGHPCFFVPAVLTGVRPGHAVFDEETFGPVAAVTRARDPDDAVALANTSRYGLGASVWGADRGRATEVALRLEAGSVFVNGIVASDPRLPFGGIKHSGHGCELGEAGLFEFVHRRVLWVGPTP